jgi:hypothetical protein
MWNSFSFTETCPICSLCTSPQFLRYHAFDEDGLPILTHDDIVGDSCSCFLLTGWEETYSEQFASTPSHFEMSAHENLERVVREIACDAESTRLVLPSIGFDDSACFPHSLFAAGNTLPFGKSSDSMSNDDHWLNFAAVYASSNARELSHPHAQIQRNILDGATVFDWSSAADHVWPIRAQQASMSCFYRGVTERQVTDIISGVGFNMDSLVAAEGLFVRCILSASLQPTRLSLVSLWCVVILRLGGSTMLGEVLAHINTIESIGTSIAACGVGTRMQGAFRRSLSQHIQLAKAWGSLVDEVFFVRATILQGMQYDVPMCGLHPPEHCVTNDVGRVEGVGVEPMGANVFAYTPESSDAEEGELSDGEVSEPDSEGDIVQTNGMPFVGRSDEGKIGNSDVDVKVYSCSGWKCE